MIGRKKTPQHFTITPGDPWTINGQPTPARNPHDALAEILDQAKRFPVHVEVITEDQAILLEMDEQGRTTPIEDPEEPAEETEAEPVEEATPVAEDTDLAEELIGSDQPALARKITPLRVAIPALALLVVVGAGAALGLSGGGKDTPEATPSTAAPSETPQQGWTLPDGQDAVAVLGNRVVTAENTTIRLYDAATGDQVGESYQVKDPDQIRYLQGTTTGAVDTGDGRVILLKDKDPEVFQGTLNARGTEPVIVKDRDYIDADGARHSLSKTQAVLAGITDHVVLAENPNKITVGDTSAELKAPQARAKITQWVGAGDHRAVVVWSKDKSHWITSHDLATGAVKLREEIGGSKVSVRAGVIQIGSDRYLQGDQIKQICSGGAQIDSTIICPRPQGWIAPGTSETFPDRPEAISKTHVVINGTVTPVRTEQ